MRQRLSVLAVLLVLVVAAVAPVSAADRDQGPIRDNGSLIGRVVKSIRKFFIVATPLDEIIIPKP